jgi:hypothetical protein
MAASPKYPTRWLTFQQRVRADLEDTFQASKAAGDLTFFTEGYLTSLAAPLKQQEEWIVKLLFFQATILGFLAVGFVSPETKLTVFGFDLKGVDGLREIHLAISATPFAEGPREEVGRERQYIQQQRRPCRRDCGRRDFRP